MMGRLRKYPDKQESATSALTRLTMLLINCSDDVLADMTAEKLAATHRVKPDVCIRMLREQRERRSGR